MLPVRHIVYVGCGLAGKLYSLTSALQRCGQRLPSSEWVFRQDFQNFRLTRQGQPLVELFVRTSDRRASIVDYDPTSSDDSQIQQEIDAIANADGLVMVLDSRLGREEANLNAFRRLQRDAATRRVDLLRKPIVFQANKRDLPEVVSMDWIRDHFRAKQVAYIESSAMNHTGTLEALREVLRLTGAIG